MATQVRSAVGDMRTVAGITFTATEELRTFDHKPRGVRWTAGPIALSIGEQWEKQGDYRFEVGGVWSSSFESAAVRSLKRRAAEVRKARELLAVYDAPQLADQRAKVEALG